MRSQVIAIIISSILIGNASAGLHAQPIAENRVPVAVKPYKVLTTGNQVTLKCTKDIKTVMAWTTGGTRILEKTILASQFSFRVPVSNKLVFLRIELVNGQTYSEKIGLN